jgi:hypothetical protein
MKYPSLLTNAFIMTSTVVLEYYWSTVLMIDFANPPNTDLFKVLIFYIFHVYPSTGTLAHPKRVC